MVIIKCLDRFDFSKLTLATILEIPLIVIFGFAAVMRSVRALPPSRNRAPQNLAVEVALKYY